MGVKFVPTPEQAAAIGSPGHPTMRAGAGSGKTEVLARRFVAMVAGDIAGLAPIPAERMAAIVFGELAAIELRARIAQVLADRIGESSGAERERLRRIRRELPLARISTIHAFCARLLRENPLAAGLDPDFQILDEFASGAFLDREARRALVDLVRADDPGARLLVAARGLDGGEYRAGAVGIAVVIASKLARLSEPPGWLVEKAEDFAASASQLRKALKECADAAIRTVEALIGAGAAGTAREKIETLRGQWSAARSTIQMLGAMQGDAEDWAALMDFVRYMPDARGSIKEMVRAVREMLPLKDDLNGRLAEAWGTIRAIEPTRITAATFAAVARRFDHARRRDRVVTFDDLLTATRRLLAERPEIAARYRSALDAVMVDEYQDVDPPQHDIIDLLTRPEDGERAPARFIVGDEKQAIFGFRGADVTVFHRALAASKEILPLSGNRRSTPNILGFVNAFGPDLMRPPDKDQPWRVKWSGEHDLGVLRTDGFNPPVELIVKTKKREDEAAAIAARIHEIIAAQEPVFDQKLGAPRPSNYGDIAILLRAFGHVARYERALAQAGIPSYTIQGRGFFGCAEIADLTELLAAIDDPQDSLALAAVLRSPLFGLSDRCLFELINRTDNATTSLAAVFSAPGPPTLNGPAENAGAAAAAWKTLKELRELRGRASLVALLERALALTDFEAVLLGLERGRQRVANVRKLIEMARRFEAEQLFSLRDFVGAIKRLADDDPREPAAAILAENDNVVRLMTVHQAKGLEFPIVFVADLARPPKAGKYSIELSPKHGLIAPATLGAGFHEIPHAMLSELKTEQSDRDAAERARLFYVALTRARDRLILSEGAVRYKAPSENTWARQLRDFLGNNGIDVAGFADSDQAKQAASLGAVELVLRRPANEPARPPAAAGDNTAKRAELAEIARARRDFAAPAGGELIVDPSSLEDFARCPRQYFLRRKLGLPETPLAVRGAKADAPDATADATALGIVVHKILETLDFGADPDAIERKAVEVASAYETPAEARRAIVRDLRRYLATAAGRPPAHSRCARELPFFMCAAEGDPAIFIRGRIDLLIIDGRRAIVRDYKYSRPSKDRDAAEYALAGQCYALAAGAAHPECEIKAEVVYLRGGVSRVELNLPALGQIRERVTALGRALAAASRIGEWPQTPKDRRECQRLRCGYVSRCWGGD